jgi:hypothetical protein
VSGDTACSRRGVRAGTCLYHSSQSWLQQLCKFVKRYQHTEATRSALVSQLPRQNAGKRCDHGQLDSRRSCARTPRSMAAGTAVLTLKQCPRVLDAYAACKRRRPGDHALVCRHLQAMAGWCALYEICPDAGALSLQTPDNQR